MEFDASQGMSMANGHPWYKCWQHDRNKNAYFTIAVNEHNMLQHIEDDLIYASWSASLHIFSTLPLSSSCDYSATFSSINQQLPPPGRTAGQHLRQDLGVIFLGGANLPVGMSATKLTSKLTWRIDHVGVSKNRGTPKWMVFNGKPY